jgi:hypothetical protein
VQSLERTHAQPPIDLMAITEIQELGAAHDKVLCRRQPQNLCIELPHGHILATG